MIQAVRTSWLRGLAIVVTASGCGLVPVSYGQAPPECGMFGPGAQLEWAGHGTPDEFGLYTPHVSDRPLLPGRISVGIATEHDPPDRVWCVVPAGPQRRGESPYYYGPVPEDWVPPL